MENCYELIVKSKHIKYDCEYIITNIQGLILHSVGCLIAKARRETEKVCCTKSKYQNASVANIRQSNLRNVWSVE